MILLGPSLPHLPAATVKTVTSTTFFPGIISGPFHAGLQLTFGVAAAMMALATLVCLLAGRPARTRAYAPVTTQPAYAPATAQPADLLSEEEADLEAQIRQWRQLATAAGSAAPLVITVNSAIGAGGDLVAERLAERLSLPFVDRAIPAAVAQQLAVPLASAEALDEQRTHAGLRLLVSAANAEPLFGLEVAPADFDDEERFRLATEAALWKLAATTGGVVLGRASVVILAAHPRALHLRFVASGPTRIREHAGLDEREAARGIERTDRARAAFAHHLYGVDLSDPALYDLIVATDKISFEDATEVVMAFLAASQLL